MMKQSTMDAFAEVDIILSYMDSAYVQQIPKKLRKLFKEKKTQNYTKKINPSKPLKNQNLKEDTLAILAVLHYNYWCKDENEKKKLLQRYTENEIRYQEILRKKYNPNNIFANRNNTYKTKKTYLIETKKSVSVKMWNKIKMIFSHNSKPIKLDDKNILEIIDLEGNRRKILVLLCFTLKTDKNDYIVYIDNQKRENSMIYTSQLIQNKDTIKLKNIEDAKIIKEITEIVKELKFYNTV